MAVIPLFKSSLGEIEFGSPFVNPEICKKIGMPKKCLIIPLVLNSTEKGLLFTKKDFSRIVLINCQDPEIAKGFETNKRFLMEVVDFVKKIFPSKGFN